MSIYSFDGNDFKMMLRGAADLLGQSKEEIDALNVFPVPDGDTGTNMYKTLMSAVEEAETVDTAHIGLVARAAARGCLLGARGNSGVILSQFLHGFAASLESKETAAVSDITLALREGAEVAYQAVMRPVEGTILTVVRKLAEGAGASAERSSDLLRLIVFVLRKSFAALNETPDQLPVLKQAGVVDAGGKGFVVILEGMLSALKKASPLAKASLQTGTQLILKEEAPPEMMKTPALVEELSGFAYCTELLVKGNCLPLEQVKRDLIPCGDCLMVVGEQALIKVHIHTGHPGIVLEHCLKYGALHDIKINNMAEQQKEMAGKLQEQGEKRVPGTNIKPAEKTTLTGKSFAVVSVASGSGLIKIMESLGADIMVAGGQTLNPSVGEILKAVEEASSAQVIVLPNNKNIVQAAEQAGKLSAKRVLVVPSKSIPQGLAALLTLNPEDDLETAGQKMAGALAGVVTGEITCAVRDATYNGLSIRKGDLIGIWEGEPKAAGADLGEVVDRLLSGAVEGTGKLITFYYGKLAGEVEIQKIIEKLRRQYPRQEFDLQYGGQEVYDLIISIE